MAGMEKEALEYAMCDVRLGCPCCSSSLSRRANSNLISSRDASGTETKTILKQNYSWNPHENMAKSNLMCKLNKNHSKSSFQSYVWMLSPPL